MQKGLREEKVCVTKVQCLSWDKPKWLIGKTCIREEELVSYEVGVFTNIPPERLGLKRRYDINYILKIFELYSKKMGMECCFKDSLIDLNGHHPPSKNIKHNRGYYALLSLAHNLGRAIDLVANKEDRDKKRKSGKKFNTRMRIATLRRKLFALPAFIKVHSRKSIVRLIGGAKITFYYFRKLGMLSGYAEKTPNKFHYKLKHIIQTS